MAASSNGSEILLWKGTEEGTAVCLNSPFCVKYTDSDARLIADVKNMWGECLVILACFVCVIKSSEYRQTILFLSNSSVFSSRQNETAPLGVEFPP